MSPSTTVSEVLLEAREFDVRVGGRCFVGDKWSAHSEATVGNKGVCDEDPWKTDLKVIRVKGNWIDVNALSNDTENAKALLQPDSKLTNGIQNMQDNSSGKMAVSNTVIALLACEIKCLGRVMYQEGSTEPQTRDAAATTQTQPTSWCRKTPIIQGSAAPVMASKPDPAPIASRSKQDQRTRPTITMSQAFGQHCGQIWNRASPATGRAVSPFKSRSSKNLSRSITVNPLFGTTSYGSRVSFPAAAMSRTPPRLWEVTLLLLTLLLAAPVNGRYDRGGPQHSITWGRGNSHNSAVFGNVPTNVTAVLGHRARLPCQVKNLGHKDVSWIRQRDLHILTVGIFTYTSDDRFKVFHPPETEDWFLEISSVTFRDSGVYECQVSTSPKVSLPIHLTVLAVQEAEIPGPREVFIQHGSTISLQCEVRAGVEAVGLVRWYHGAAPLNYSSPRGGISMEVEKTPTMTTSKLYITRAVRADSGNYTCAPKFSKPDSVIVHVVNAGEESAAAVQSGVEGVRACMGVVWVVLLLAASLTATPPAPRRP